MGTVDSPLTDDLPTNPTSLLSTLTDADGLSSRAVVSIAIETLGDEWSTRDIVLLASAWLSADYEDMVVRARRIGRDIDGASFTDWSDEEMLNRCCEVVAEADDDVTHSLSGAEVRQAVDDSDSLLEFTRTLRVSRVAARKYLSRIGLRDELSRDMDAVLDEIRDAYDMPDMSDVDNQTPAWKRHRDGGQR